MRAALREARALALEYYSASRDVLSHRVVDPIRVVILVGDQLSGGMVARGGRSSAVRFDRIVDATVLDKRQRSPNRRSRSGPDTSLFDADPLFPWPDSDRAGCGLDAGVLPDACRQRVCRTARTVVMKRFASKSGSGGYAGIQRRHCGVLDPPSLWSGAETAGAALAAAELDD